MGEQTVPESGCALLEGGIDAGAGAFEAPSSGAKAAATMAQAQEDAADVVEASNDAVGAEVPTIPDDIANVAAAAPLKLVRMLGKLPASGYSHDSLGVNAAWAHEQGLRNGQHVAVYNPERRTHTDCHVRFTAKAEAGKALISVKLREKLAIPVDALDELLIVPLSGAGYDKVGLQSLENMKDDKLYLPPADYDRIDRRYGYYLLECLETGCIIPVPTSSITRIAEGKNSTTILLNRYQRLLLRLEAPVELSPEKKQRILIDPRLNDDEREVIAAAYETGMRGNDVDYGQERAIYGALAKIGFMRVELTPLVDSYIPAAPKKTAGETMGAAATKITDAFLGASSLMLRCVRPYDVDESREVVRLSPDTMALLGIDETDQVILRNGNKRVEARVLALDNREELEKTNLMGSWESADIVVGVPTTLRHKLGVRGVGTCIEVERDTGYLFMKNLNLQFLTMLGLFLTILQTVPAFGVDPVVATIAFVVLLPFVIYIVLSGERKRVK